MRNFTVFSAAFILFVGGLCRVTPANGSADAHLEPADTQEFVELEKVWNEAHLKGDAAALERLWSNDLQIVVPKMPVMSRADVVSFARSGRMKFERYTTSNLNVRRYGDIVVVSGEMQRSRKMPNGQVVDDNWHFTKVYSHTAGHWQVVMFQATDAPVT